MNIKIHNIPIKQLYEGYIDQGEDGVFGFDEQLSIRPPFQREFVYKMPQQIEVIKSILKGYPLNVMYWMIAEKNEDEEPCKFELIDGQQRTISICRCNYALTAKSPSEAKFRANRGIWRAHQLSQNIVV